MALSSGDGPDALSHSHLWPSLAVDTLGNVYVALRVNGIETGVDYAVVKYDSNGVQMWEAVYDANGGDDYSIGLAVDALGNSYVTGYGYFADTGRDYVTIKYDTDGNQLWAARYNGSANGWDHAYGVGVDNVGNVYVAGSSYTEHASESYSDDYTTVKYDAAGHEIWVRHYDSGNDYDWAEFMAVDQMGNVYVTGRSKHSSQKCVWVEDIMDNVCWGHGDYLTIKYDTSGTRLWAARYDGPAGSTDMPNGITFDDSGNTYVTGYSARDHNCWLEFPPDEVTCETDDAYTTIKYSPGGSRLWVRHYDSSHFGHAGANAVVVDSHGNVYVTGYSEEDEGWYCVTVKYDSGGNELWTTQRFNGGGSALTLDGAGNVYVGNGGGSTVVKYDPNGNEFWSVNYEDADGGIGVYDLWVDDLNSLYVTGFGNHKSATIKYIEADCSAYPAMDFTEDCRVDFQDFAVFLQSWLECSLSPPEACMY